MRKGCTEEDMEQILVLMKNSLDVIRWQDILDILLIWFLLYKISKLIRDTSAGQVVKGLIVLVIFMQVVGWLQLNVIYYLLSSALQIGIIALIILFQPELRRMLDTIGRSRLPALFTNSEAEDLLANENARSINKLVDTCGYFSRTRTGALIAVERETKLGDIMKSGTMIDSEISGELLKNLFYNKAPLHDGAVIVRKNRVAAAGCVLPLSLNKNLSPDLGTRHRAGVGLSENSDAVVIIVSEETGAVSVAIGGLLKRNLSPETLKAILTKELITETDTKAKLEKFRFWRSKNK